jgi:hypothetical protein
MHSDHLHASVSVCPVGPIRASIPDFIRAITPVAAATSSSPVPSRRVIRNLRA